MFKKRAPKAVAVRKRRQQSDEEKRSDGSEESDSSDGEGVRRGGKLGQALKQAGGVTVAAGAKRQKVEDKDLHVVFEGDRTAVNRNTNDATREAANVDGYDEAALLGKRRGTDKTANGTQTGSPEKATSAQRARQGPVKAASNIRSITVTDYQPDVCKDYKKTGFCGFGDTCKFLHDRGDYKQGWQLDRDWENAAKAPAKTAAATEKEKKDSKVDELPFACILCQKDYKNPIVTRCGHFFCEKCALDRYKKDPSCGLCGQSTNGIFNGAKRLLEAKRANVRAALADSAD